MLTYGFIYACLAWSSYFRLVLSTDFGGWADGHNLKHCREKAKKGGICAMCIWCKFCELVGIEAYDRTEQNDSPCTPLCHYHGVSTYEVDHDFSSRPCQLRHLFQTDGKILMTKKN